MATIGELLDRLAQQVHDLHPTRDDTAASHAVGWMPLARATGQAITLLPLGGHSDQVKAGIRTVLEPLAHGPRPSAADAAAAPQLADLAMTVGAISDSLAGILRRGPRPEQEGTPALQLEAELLSGLHVAARWSRTAIERDGAADRFVPTSSLLADLAIVTEPYALIPPQHRASIFEDLAFIAPSSLGREGIVASWAITAMGVLADHYRVSGWALQTTAADLALIADATRPAFAAVIANSRGSGVASDAAVVALDGSVVAWRRAAAWPPHVRLGGHNPDLRRSTRDLRESLMSAPVSRAAEALGLIGISLPVAAAYVRAMDSVVRKHELWINTPYLVPRVGYDRGWIREPSWSGEGRPLLEFAEAGQRALDQALSMLCVDVPERSRGERPRWPAETRRVVMAHQDDAGQPANREISNSPSV